jgi:hypothetical protein
VRNCYTVSSQRDWSRTRGTLPVALPQRESRSQIRSGGGLQRTILDLPPSATPSPPGIHPTVNRLSCRDVPYEVPYCSCQEPETRPLTLARQEDSSCISHQDLSPFSISVYPSPPTPFHPRPIELSACVSPRWAPSSQLLSRSLRVNTVILARPQDYSKSALQEGAHSTRSHHPKSS